MIGTNDDVKLWKVMRRQIDMQGMHRDRHVQELDCSVLRNLSHGISFRINILNGILTIWLAQATFRRKVRRRYSKAIIFNRTIASRIINRYIYVGATGIQRVLQELKNHAIETADGGRRFYLSDDIGRQLLYRHCEVEAKERRSS